MSARPPSSLHQMAFSPASLSEDGDGGGSASFRRSAPSPDVEKVCRVCGDKAIGYNFGIVACESCKSFFRRQATRADELRCPFNGNCEINKGSRRFCQSCRLKKCFAMGMSTELLRRAEREGTSRKKPRIASKELEQMIDDGSDEEVTVPKEVLQELIRKSKDGERLSECICRCRCGFYAKGTRLTSRSALPKDPPPPSSHSAPSAPSAPSTLSPTSPRVQTAAVLPVQPVPVLPPMPSMPGSLSPEVLHPSALNMQSAVTKPAFSALSALGPSVAPPFDPPPWYIAPDIRKPLEFSWYNSNLAAGVAKFQAVNMQHLPVAGSSFSEALIRNARHPEPSNSFAYAGAAGPSTAAPSTLSQLMQAGRPPENVMEKLPETERELLQELIKANECLKAPLDIGLPQEEFSLMEVVNITNLALRRIIFMAKELQSFKSLSNQDQMNLIKGGASELLILRGVMVFDPEKNMWNHQAGQGFKEMQVKLDILLRSPAAHQHYEEHKRFLTSFNDRLRKNENVMLILTAIVLFSPDRPNLEDRQTVARIQKTYYELLLRALTCEFPESEAGAVFDGLLRRLVDLHKINEGLLNIYYRLDPNQLDPLLLELFDLKTIA